MSDDVEHFLEVLAEGELPLLIAMGGPERLFLDEALGHIRRRVLAGGLADFNHDRASAKQRSADEIVSLARTLPTFAPRRLVEVHDADALAEENQALQRYLDDPAPETVLVFVFDTLDLRARLPKRLKKEGLLCRFDHPKERELPRLVRMRARKHGLRMSAESEEALALTVGADLGLLERALEKLALIADHEEVTLQHISEHVADTHLEDAFSLARAVAEGNRAAALESLAALERARSAPLQLVGLLAWQLRQLLRARGLLDRGMSPDEVGKALNAWGARAQALASAARRIDGDAHRARLLRLAAADQALKRSRVPAALQMHRLILELCPVAPRRTR